MHTDRSVPLSFDSLETRRLMSGSDDGLGFEAYFPEGYSHAGISEFVPLTNPHDRDVRYELHARYEVGERDQLISKGVLPARSRGGVTISLAGRPDLMLVRPDTPYALVLKAEDALGATISHYDFGTAIGESFSTTPSTRWTFGEGYRDHNWTRDFVLFYNPNGTSTQVTTRVFGAGGETVTLELTLDGQRRGGWNFDTQPGLPDGVFAVEVVATAPIVASQSHYEIVTERGFGALGTADGGALAGFIPAIEFEDHGPRVSPDGPEDDNGGHGNDDGDDTNDDNGGHGNDDGDDWPANAFLTVLNTSDENATVTFTFLWRDDVAAPTPREERIVIPANSRGGLSIRELGVPFDEEFGVLYLSDVPVTVTAVVYQAGDAMGIPAATVAATTWDFGEGYMSRSRAGKAVTDDVYVFNPTGASVTVTIEFFFSDGRSVVVPKRLDPLELEDVKVHAEKSVLDLGEDLFYGVRVSAPRVVVAGFEHWDRDLGGGFATIGIPGGEIMPLLDALNTA
ncbi:MAG: hypothetical protein M5U20_07945 [Phycisphaerales bacterium]|nr:hypothetical protein [Phycisphaerales bacterium]